VAGAAVVVAALAAGCSGDGGAVSLSVTTPPASATAGAAARSQGTPGTSAPAPTPSVAAPIDVSAQTYRSMVTDWQLARSVFFGGVSSGQPTTVTRQRALAAQFRAAQGKFQTALTVSTWPVRARPAVRTLVARVRGQSAVLAAMAAAHSKGEFTAGLADYGIGTGAEDAAVSAVATALG
jgi:hypothetical protein